jgi:uncharacterized protein (DUF362 family)
MEKFLYQLESFLRRQISRRRFLQMVLSGLLLFVAENKFLKLAFAKTGESAGRPKRNIKGDYDLAVAEGNDSYQNTVKVIEALGGMERFVAKGSTVVVKPNMAWDRSPEQAANTDPRVVAALVELCYKAGAKRVNVFDVTCNDARRAYENSGIEKAAKEKGAYVYFADNWNVLKARFSGKSPMEDWPILRDAIVCDTFINVPVLKHHGLTGMTLSMKNLMGVCSGSRGLMHAGIGPKLVDLTGFISPELTVIDATRYLTKNGPTGGNVADVVTLNKVFAATDPTLADAYACSLAGKDPMSIPYLQEAAARSFGQWDITKANIKILSV